MIVGLINVETTQKVWQTRACRSAGIAHDSLLLNKKTKTAIGINNFQAELSA